MMEQNLLPSMFEGLQNDSFVYKKKGFEKQQLSLKHDDKNLS
jgi:hypothetical protein